MQKIGVEHLSPHFKPVKFYQKIAKAVASYFNHVTLTMNQKSSGLSVWVIAMGGRMRESSPKITLHLSARIQPHVIKLPVLKCAPSVVSEF